MDKIFRQMLEEYLQEVELVCTNLLKHLHLKEKEELLKFVDEQRIWQLDINGVRYYFHGIGCNALYDGKYVQWNFGYGTHWCGIEPWFVAHCLKQNKSKYCQFYDGNVVKASCEAAIKAGEMCFVEEQYYLR